MQTPSENEDASPPSPGKVASSAFDLPQPDSHRLTYVIATTPRSGSTLLSRLLTQSGVLGVPAEYWNFHRRAVPVATGTQMAERLEATSPASYLAKLIACRSTANGVFGIKLHFSQLKKALRTFPDILEHMAPVKYIYLERDDKVAQAISLTKLVQGGWRAKSGDKHPHANLGYDKDVIGHYVAQLEQQVAGWSQWFEANGVEPFAVRYEDLAADNDGTVNSIKTFLGVENDEAQVVRIKTVERQGNRTNKEWAARFKSGLDAPMKTVAPTDLKPPLPSPAEPQTPHLFDRFEELRRDVTDPDSRKKRFPVAMRARQRYEGIIAKNRELFREARVLDIHCGEGRFSVAALDAGANHVVGLDNRQRKIDIAGKILAEYGFDDDSYDLIRMRTLGGLRQFDTDRFDLVLCQDLEEIPDPHQFFEQLHRLSPKHVILDTAIHRLQSLQRQEDDAPRPIAKFKISFKGKRKPKDKAKNKTRETRYLALTCEPNHDLIAMLAQASGFRLRQVDWSALGLADWVGVTDYKSGRRQTYILDRT